MEERIYVSKMVGQSFSMPLQLVDPETKKKEMVYATNAEGKKIIINNRYVPVVKYLQFQNISRSARIGYYSEYKTNDPDEIEHLEKLCDDPSNGVTRLNTYKQQKNPEMWRAEQERDKIAVEKAEKEAIIVKQASELESSKKVIAEMQEKLRKIQENRR